MTTFDMVVVGSGGGPDETNLSAYLFKPASAQWEDGIIALEAGSGIGALSHLIHRDPRLFDPLVVDGTARAYSASEIYSYVRCFLISHAHLDHISGLILSAGSLGGLRKRIYATKQSLQDLETIFSDRIWPNLASWNEEDGDFKLLYKTLYTDNKYVNVYPDVSVRTMHLNHGHNELGNYESAAFFIRHDPTSREFLFFGDVEPDSISAKPQSINVWRAAAPKIPDTLSTIFIECSWPSGRRDELLYGHLSPEHLVDELAVLAKEIVKIKQEEKSVSRSRPARKRQKKNHASVDELRGALNGVRIFIIHCKDDNTASPEERPCDVILQQVRGLVEGKELGAEILGAQQGMRIRKFSVLVRVSALIQPLTEI
ncbi:cAMP phosphodiesterases class-II-domain-containing protein [Crucibulum laeve]|uniref:cAMP phosphodiesterases class-II-domain-containing protein n=1 Tax=Crucibulum laeve TaxID=68775 RepID=A0A5C3MNN7_9AGAR|nr:cAMP phosphodiesterases class-II-domain-containing protein [Crucibulum laeve]